MTTQINQIWTQPQYAIQPTLSAPLGSDTFGQTNLETGVMLWDPAIYSQQAQVTFQYNPSSVEASYEIQSSGANAAQMYPLTSNEATLRIPTQQQVEFTLLFDRTFDMMGSVGSDHGSDVLLLGVDVDVRALKQFTGMYLASQTGTVSATADVATSTGQAGEISQGFMQMMIGYLFFSQGDYGLMYYGYVDSWDVTYTHFTQEMIPVRCSCDVSFTLLPPSSTAATATFGTVDNVANNNGGNISGQRPVTGGN